jgi:hypothetical protein
MSTDLSQLKRDNAFITDALLGDKPFMLGRYGITEGKVVYEHGILGRPVPKLTRSRLKWGVGLYPLTDEMIDSLVIEQRSAALMSDAMIFWNNWEGERRLLMSTCSRTTKLFGQDILTAFVQLERPWTSALAGQRVLVIHPFADTIMDQYDNHREKIWASPHVLPEFDMDLIEAPMTFGGKGPDENWQETLDSMRDCIVDWEEEDPFDVALIGCGGYGLPLAGFVRSMGKKALHLGGGLQLLFGIRGKRWELPWLRQNVFNDHWVRPADNEHPEGYWNVEKGCYW